MADSKSELQAKLQELDEELAEGEITQKGYQKRRTLLLSQYGALPVLEEPANAPRGGGGGLRIHNADDTMHPSSGQGSRRTSFMGNAAPNATQEQSEGQDSPFGYGGSTGRLTVRNDPSRTSLAFDSSTAQGGDSYDNSRAPTMMSANYAFKPGNDAGYDPQEQDQVSPEGAQTRASTMMDQGYFSDFTGAQGGDKRESSYYGGPQHRYSQTQDFSPTAGIPPPAYEAGNMPPPAHLQLPLEPRDLPFAVYDPHNTNVPMSKFDNIAAVLRHRAKAIPKQSAFWVLDNKGKEIASITFDKLGSRAEKVAQVIRDKSNLYRADRVCLIYRDSELIDFAVALLGCFIAGVVAVPFIEKNDRSNFRADYNRLNVILTTTQAHLALTTDTNLKNFQRDITTYKLNWPRGVEWWKTNEFGSYHPKKKDEMPPVVVPDLGYIEFSTAPTGDLRGVVMSHRTIMHQMACLSAVVSTIPSGSDTFKKSLYTATGRPVVSGTPGETILSYLDPRQSIGMIIGVLFAVYGGHTTVWIGKEVFETHGLYAHLLTRQKATLMVADYPGLRQAVYNYQLDPMTTRNFKKNFEPNFSSVKLCMIDTLTVDAKFHDMLADRWLRPMRSQRARELVAPMLCLPEHGGMVISMRDWLGGEERMGCILDSMENGDTEEGKKVETPQTSGFSTILGGKKGVDSSRKPASRTDLSEVLLDKESLKTNEVVVLAHGEEAQKRDGEPGTVRVGAFGYPIPDATMAVVDPETSLLCTPHVVGEIWVDSPSLSGGFWALPKHTETIFHARPYKFEEGNPTPMAIEPEFLRTGLLGTVIDGKLYILGLYEDRIRQRVEWVEHGMEVAEHRYFFVQHLVLTILERMSKMIFDASAFDTEVNNEHLPIMLLESPAASTAPTTNGGPPRPLDTALLDKLSELCMDVLYQEHHLRVYVVMICAPNTLPRVLKNGREEIGNMLCRREFDAGAIQCVHVKFGVERSVMNLPIGVDPAGGIWSMESTKNRAEILGMQDKQYSGVDYREVVIDDRTSTPLTNFQSIVDLLQWRVARQADDLAYCTVDARGKEGKPIAWKKLDTKIAAVSYYLQNKVKLKAGDHAILMYTHSEDFVFAIHACLCLGIVAIPMAPLDSNRLNEDAPAFLHLTTDYRVKAVLVNGDVEHLLKQKNVTQHIKQSAQVLRVSLTQIYNTSSVRKQNHGCRDLKFTMQPSWVQHGRPALIWTYWTPDQRRIAVQIGHDTIMGMCKVQKETCQMTSSRPVVGCVRSISGLGFIYTCLMGVFVGAPTYLVSPVDFAQNPSILFTALSRYKVKDTYATSQMLAHAMAAMPAKGFQLHELKNMMITTDGRPGVDVFQKVRLHFAAAGLDRTAINTIYSHQLNPMIASRSYMCIEPIELWLDPRALRRGLVYPVDPDSDPGALQIQDSGMVPVNTQIAIVNPETNMLCHIGEYGEIWVQSEACVSSFYGSKDPFDAERFGGRTADGDTSVTYVRTGDLGFLHTVVRPIGPNGQPVEMQVLFVLGNIGETFEINGLSYFPMDIEKSVESCHRNIVTGGCAVFQAGGMVVVLVEVIRKAYLASIVPVIVNAVLSEHQLIADIVAFVGRGDFPRSRLGEKQRGKILASWVTRKLRTIAQFSIRDPEAAENGITGVPGEEGQRGSGSTRGSIRGSSIRGSVLSPGFANGGVGASAQEPIYEVDGGGQMHSSLPPGVVDDTAEMLDDGAPYESSITESPPLDPPRLRHGNNDDQDTTPTAQHGFSLPTQGFATRNDDYFAQPESKRHDPEATPQPQERHFEYDEQAAPQVVIGHDDGVESMGVGQAISPDEPTYKGQHGGWYPDNSGTGQRVSYVPYRPGGGGASKGYGGRYPSNGAARLEEPGDNDSQDWSREALQYMNLGERD